MDESRPSRSTRPIWPLLSLLAAIFVLGVLLTQVDLSKLISPLLAGKASGRPESSAVMGVMLIILVGVSRPGPRPPGRPYHSTRTLMPGA